MKNYNYDLDSLQRTLNLIQKGDNKIILEDCPNIIICGDTGSGKSTLINYLLGEKLVAVKPQNSRKLCIDTVSKKPLTKIGHNLTSETLIPKKIKAENFNIIYWDCPGFDDTRGPEIDISNAFFINKLFNQNTLKTMIVIDEPSLNGSKRGKAFKELVTRLSELFVNKEDFLKSTSIIFTKVRDIEDFRSELESFVEEIKDNVSTKELKILKAIVERSPIATFDLPLREGPIDATQMEKINEAINSSEFISKPEVKITVATESLMALQQLTYLANKKIGGLIKSISDQLITEVNHLCLEELEKVNQGLKDIITNPVAVHTQIEKIEQVCSIILAKNTASNIEKDIRVALNEIKTLNSYFDNFFSKVIPDAKVDDTKLKGPFLIKLCYQVELCISKIINKDNEEKLNQAISELNDSRNAYEAKLEQREQDFENIMKAKEKQMADIMEKLQQEQQNRTNFDNILNQQNNLISSLQTEIKLLKEAPKNDEAFKMLSEQMLALTNKVIEMGNNPPEVHYHTTNYYEEDSGFPCVIS